MNMVTLTESIILKDVLPINKFNRLHDDLRSGWEYGNVSEGDNPNDTYESWGKKYDDVNDPLVYMDIATYISYKVRRLVKSKLYFYRAHINGQTCGQPSMMHYDADIPAFTTVVLFTSQNWDTNWGGEFVCYNPIKGRYEYTPYIPNTAVVIPSSWEHKGSNPNNVTHKLRTSVGFMYCDDPKHLRQYNQLIT